MTTEVIIVHRPELNINLSPEDARAYLVDPTPLQSKIREALATLGRQSLVEPFQAIQAGEN